MVLAGARTEEIEGARAALEAARAKLEIVNVSIEELTVKAARPARVESIDLRPGDMLVPGAPAAVLLEDGQLYVRIYIPETQIGRVHVGQTLPVKADSSLESSIDGVVTHINSIGEYSPRNLQTADERADQVFAARVEVSSANDALRTGMAAFVSVPQ
jgi:multidrug resistance efflux pump